MQKFVVQFDALPLILPVTSSLAGNVGCIFASRLSTHFHINASNLSVDRNTLVKSRDNVIVMGTLFLISLPIHLAFLGFIHLLGTFKFGVLFLIAYVITGALAVFRQTLLLLKSRFRLLLVWRISSRSCAGREGIIRIILYWVSFPR